MLRRRFILKTLLIAGGAVLGPLYWKERWRYIVIHHSAGDFGNIDFLQKVHRQRQSRDPIDAIPYHYIVGNGNGLGMGEIASDGRREYHIWGAHVSKNNADRNFRGIGICLIGNYEQGPVPDKQYQALINLTKTLMSKYDIPPDNVSGHGLIDGESTKCPGRHFPMEKFIQDIS